MALTNEQYNSINKMYTDRRLSALSLLEEKKKKLFASHPDLKEIRDALSKNAAFRAKAQIAGLAEEMDKLLEEKEALLKREENLYQMYHLSKEDFLPRYICKDCQDTGFIHGEKCHCFLQAEIALLYADSNLGTAILQDSFDKIDYSLYEEKKEGNGPSQLEYMTDVVASCKRFVANFGRESRNLLFIGQSGLGKTFLSNCIAKSLLDSGHSVVYFSSVQLFELFSKNLSSYDKESTQQMNDALLSSELLIIDDLGTERLNGYLTGKFFSVINDRLLRGKSTIISTNLSRNQLSELYGERIASRILSGYEHFVLAGEDLRIKMKLRKL